MHELDKIRRVVEKQAKIADKFNIIGKGQGRLDAVASVTGKKSYGIDMKLPGLKVIGGCCGTMPEHLRAMRHALETTPPGPRPSLETISDKLGGFSSASDGTGDPSGDPKRERRGRRGWRR